MFLAVDITKPWCICLKGDPIEVISARDKNAIVIKCKGERLTVSQFDITDINPLKMEIKPAFPAINIPKVESNVPKPAIAKQLPTIAKEVKPAIKGIKPSQPIMF